MKPTKVEVLLYELCIKLGYCLPPKDIVRLSENPPGTVDDFTKAVFTAEGVEYAGERQRWRSVRDIVAQHFSRWEEESREEPNRPRTTRGI